MYTYDYNNSIDNFHIKFAITVMVGVYYVIIIMSDKEKENIRTERTIIHVISAFLLHCCGRYSRGAYKLGSRPIILDVCRPFMAKWNFKRISFSFENVK